MSKFIKAFVRDERGVSALEYAIMAAIVTLALAGIGTTFSTNISTMFNSIWTNVNSASGNAAKSS